MARDRLILHEILADILGSRNVYFEPPENTKLKYPCIVYERNNYHVDYADNMKYHTMKRYQITLIGIDPDSKVPDKLMELPYCSYDRPFVSDHLHHDVFILYF